MAKNKLRLAGVQDVRWDKISTEEAGEYEVFHRNKNENYELGTGFLCTYL
jgi:hypothetical protein